MDSAVFTQGVYFIPMFLDSSGICMAGVDEREYI
jgi:hypothetical protein|tara:strand:- start:303 stop:404 length:102 start_codon:yes stop_codon:yes gene_type:complete